VGMGGGEGVHSPEHAFRQWGRWRRWNLRKQLLKI